MNAEIKNENIVLNYAAMHNQGLINDNEFFNAMEFYAVKGGDVVTKELQTPSQRLINAMAKSKVGEIKDVYKFCDQFSN